MEISRWSGERCIDVSMGINPDHTKVWAVLGMATNGTNCQAAKNKYSDPQGPLLGKLPMTVSAGAAHTTIRTPKAGFGWDKSPWTYSFQRLILSELGGNGRLWRFKTNHWLPLQCDKWYCCPQIHIIWSISPGPEKYFKYLFNEWNPVKWCVLYVTSHKYCSIHVKGDQGDLIISKRSINFLRVKISIVM